MRTYPNLNCTARLWKTPATSINNPREPDVILATNQNTPNNSKQFLSACSCPWKAPDTAIDNLQRNVRPNSYRTISTSTYCAPPGGKGIVLLFFRALCVQCALCSRACHHEAFFSKSLAWVFFCCLFMFRNGLKKLKNLGQSFHDWKMVLKIMVIELGKWL